MEKKLRYESQYQRCLADVREAVRTYINDPTSDNAELANRAWGSLKHINAAGRWRQWRAKRFTPGARRSGRCGRHDAHR